MSRMSRDKGKRGERMFRDLCRDAGFAKTERTGWHQSFAGNAAPDCRIPELPTIWPEVKFVEKLNVRAAYRQAETAAAMLEDHGYQRVGVDHFARPSDSLAAAAREGRVQRNFQGYTVDPADALIGLGASAIGKLPQGYVQNEPAIAGYQ